MAASLAESKKEVRTHFVFAVSQYALSANATECEMRARAMIVCVCLCLCLCLQLGNYLCCENP